MDSVHAYLIPQLSDILTGFGLSALLEFSRCSPDMQYFTAICLAVVLAAGAGALIFPVVFPVNRAVNPVNPANPVNLVNPANPANYSKPPAWLCLCNTTYSLIVTLALSLNLLSQLCPPSGRDLCLIPVYVLLCVPRIPPSDRALLLQAGFGVLLLGVFASLPTSRPARPSGDVGDGLALAVSVLAGVCLNTFGFRGEALELGLVQPDRRWQAAAMVCKGLLLVLLGSLSDTPLYHFMYEKKNPVPVHLFVCYGILLLFAGMQTASVWFMQLKEMLGRQAQWRLVVRIQHIIYALIVAAAWLFPLQMHTLRVLLLSVLLGLNALSKLNFW